MEQTIVHIFKDTTPERHWRTFLLDDAYERGLYTHMRLSIDHKQIKQQGEGIALVVERELHLTPDRQIPGVLAKLLRGATLVKERGRYDASTGKMPIHVELPVIGAVVDLHGHYESEALPDGSFKRTWHASCKTRIPIVGRAIEKYLLNELTASMEQAYAFTRDWLARHVDD